MNKSVERNNLLVLLNTALESVQGRGVVSRFLRSNARIGNRIALLAIGKAAFSMCQGAVDVFGDKISSGLLITNNGRFDCAKKWPNIECLISAHPVPDERTLQAGDRLLDWLEGLSEKLPLYVLISGGTSSLVEKLPEGLSLSDLQKLNQWLLSSGQNIEQINRIRRSVSLLKGGRLLKYVNNQDITQVLISDVPGDDPVIIGSGLFVRSDHPSVRETTLPDWLRAKQISVDETIHTKGLTHHTVSTHIVASNRMACEAIQKKAFTLGYKSTIVTTNLNADVNTTADQIMSYLEAAEAGCYIWGGETTITLPEQPGRGGRNQHLALLLARKIEGHCNLYILCAGTDGRDGASEDAGALVDGQTITRGQGEGFCVATVLAKANAGSFLEASGDLVNTGPTGTNVMDLVIALKS